MRACFDGHSINHNKPFYYHIIMKKTAFTLLLMATCLLGLAQYTGNSAKTSPYLASLTQQFGTKTTPIKNVKALVTLAVPCHAPAFFQSHGIRLIDSIGRIYIVDLPLAVVAELSCNDTIERMEAERMPQPALDVTPQQVNASGVYLGDGLPQAYTGEGVAAGVFDCYFDFTHPAFEDQNGDLRVRYYYDFHWPNADSTLGHALLSTAEIAQYEHSQHTRNNIHGTHVMGIMGGSPVNGQLKGLAPDADLYVVDFNSDRDQFDAPDANTSATAVLGFKYIFDQAEADGKPCVINFSSCESVTLTTQRVLESEALRLLVGPGRIIVAAAGNDGFRSSYFEKGASDFQAGTGIKNGISSGQYIDLDLVTPGNQYVRFDFLGIQLIGGGIEGTIAFHTDSINPISGNHFTVTTSMGDVSLDVTVSPYQDPRGTVYHIHGVMPNITYLVLCGATVLLTSNNPAWMYSDISVSPFTNIEGVPQYCFAQPGYSVSWPATMPEIIAVGATGYKPTFTNLANETNSDMITFAPAQNGLITTFSSCGPAIDGRTKPDVVAPGLNISAAYNSFYTDLEGIRKNLTHSVIHNGKTYYYLAESGTSMAAPVVAGVIALWLQAKPNLTPAQILDVFRETSTHPDTTLSYPNNTYGYGQIDAYRGLLYILEQPWNIPQLSQHQPQKVQFRLDQRILYADFGGSMPRKITFSVYALNGSLLLTKSGRDHIDLSALPSGVYAVQLTTDQRETTGSTLVRL